MKRTYIYRLEAGYDKKPPEVIEFFYAPNAKRLIQYAQTMYHEKKYNKYKPVKVGISRDKEPIRMISSFEAAYLKKNMNGEFYSERYETE